MGLNGNMTLNFSELKARVSRKEPLTINDVVDILSSGPGAKFALVELAAQQRTEFFGREITIANLLGAAPLSDIPQVVVTVADAEDDQTLALKLMNAADELESLTHGRSGQLVLDFLPVHKVSDAAQTLSPMRAVGVLVALRLLIGSHSLFLRQQRVQRLQSLQSLGLHVLDTLAMEYDQENASLSVFEDLVSIRNARLEISNIQGRDIIEEHIAFFESQGDSDARSYAEVLLGEDGGTSGGCGGNCGCGSGGCG